MSDDNPNVAETPDDDTRDDASESKAPKADDFEEKEAELHADLENIVDSLDDEKADAVAALGEAAEESLETREVRLSDDLVLEVKDRLDPRAERQVERVEKAQEDADRERAARHAAAALSHQVVSPDEYTDSEVWEVAAEVHGMDYVLNEVAELVIGPLIEEALEKQKKYDPSSRGGTERETTR